MKVGPYMAFVCIAVLIILASVHEAESHTLKGYGIDLRVVLGVFFHLVVLATAITSVDGKLWFVMNNKFALAWISTAVFVAVVVAIGGDEVVKSVYMWASAATVTLYIVFNYNNLLTSLLRANLRVAWGICEKVLVSVISIPRLIMNWLVIRLVKRCQI